ncbi:MAG: hypothetical protein ACP5RP_03610 [Candidatus Micrarchaeia archaeon]
MSKKKAISLYDIEEFIREAGAEKVNEKAVISLERNIEDMLSDLIDEAKQYASYAGRSSLIKTSDIELAVMKPQKESLKLLLAKKKMKSGKKRIKAPDAQNKLIAFSANPSSTNASSMSHM